MEELRAAKRRLGLLTLLTQLALFLEQLIRLLAPALALLIGFVALSWTGIWLAAPPAGRIAGGGALAVLLLLALSRLRHLRWPSRASARARLDRGREDNPAAALADALANPDREPTNVLWAAHLRRMRTSAQTLSAPRPSPRLAAQDPRAWGALAILAFCATAFVAGPEKYIRLAAAFDWQAVASNNSTRVDVWIDPPRYTGKPPIVLTLNQTEAQSVSAPVGSLIVARAGNIAALGVTASEGLEPAPEKAGEKHFLLRGDSRLVLSGAARGIFVLHAEPDHPPKIALAGDPKANARGSFTLSYRIEDDYGARDAKIATKPVETAGRALVPPPEAPLDLPAAPGGLGEARATLDWSESPYAGRPVTLRLSVHDEAGQEDEASFGPFILPQKKFKDPLAQALVEQRRILALDAERRGFVHSALEALDIAPELFTPKLSIHLGLRHAILGLRHAQNDDDLRDVADYLWAMALQIEEGDMSQAERDLRAAQKALRDAMKNGASKEEIDRLTKDMQKAMENFLQEMAKKGQQRQGESQTGEGKAVSPEDFQKLLEQMKKAMEDGDMETAQSLLDQMQSMLENLQNAQGGQSQQSRDRQSRRELDKMMREQQQLRDETAEQERQKGAPGLQGREQQQAEGQEGGKGEAGKGASSKGKGEKNGEGSLEQRQGKLREKLDALRKNAPGMDEKAAEGLKQAEQAMKDAENALKQGDEAQAMSEQQRALDQMGKSAGEMAKGRDGAGQEAGGEKRGGRDKNGEGPFDNAQRSDGVKATAAQKARRILDELRKRLSDPSRAQEELDYLERLIRPN